MIRAAHPEIEETELGHQVELRRARQSRLRDGDPPRYRALLNEAVLHRAVGGPAAMDEQLGHLEAMSALPHVSLRVVPFTAGAHPVMSGSFTRLRFPDEPQGDCVYLESDRGALYLEHPADLDRYETIFNRVAELALRSGRAWRWLVPFGRGFRRAKKVVRDGL